MIHSLATWEDKLGIGKTVTDASEVVKALCREVKYDWEHPSEYRARVDRAHTLRKGLDTAERALNAEVYHLGISHDLGYYSAEAFQLVFGKAIVKGSVELLKGGLKVAEVAKEAAQAAKASQKVAQAGKELAQVAKAAGKVKWAKVKATKAVNKRKLGGVTVDTIDKNVMTFSAKKGDYKVEAITHFEVKNDKLILRQLHLEGASSGKIGRETLWEMAKDLGKQHNVKEVIIQGGRRTTGKYKRKIPSQVVIKID